MIDRNRARGSWESLYLFAVVLGTEFLAESGDSSAPQRAAGPQRTVYGERKPPVRERDWPEVSPTARDSKPC